MPQRSSTESVKQSWPCSRARSAADGEMTKHLLLTRLLACIAGTELAFAQDQIFESDGVKLLYTMEDRGQPLVPVNGLLVQHRALVRRVATDREPGPERLGDRHSTPGVGLGRATGRDSPKRWPSRSQGRGAVAPFKVPTPRGRAGDAQEANRADQSNVDGHHGTGSRGSWLRQAG